MNKALTIFSLASIGFLSGCQSSAPVAGPTAAAPQRDGTEVLPSLVMSGVEDDMGSGIEDYRNDAAVASAVIETPDFVDRSWLLTRRYESLRVTNGQPGEYSTTITRTITRGPGR